jgi:hypothetical protein
MYASTIKFIITFLFASMFLSQPAFSQGEIEVPVLLDSPGFDLEVDFPRQRAYVSLPDTNEIAIISLQSYQIINRFLVGSRPHGIALSHDGSTLFVALNGSGSVAYVDLETLAVSQVNIGAQLGDPRTYDVIEGSPDWIFASANPGSSGFSYIVLIRRDLNNIAARVASGRIIRSIPVFAADPQQQSLYVGENFSPNSLYKLDITQDSAPIILEDDHGSVSGTYNLDVTPDGNRIFLASGQILDTETFLQSALIGPGPSKLSNDGSLAHVVTRPFVAPVTIETYDTSSFFMVNSYEPTTCELDPFITSKIDLLPDEAGWLVLNANTLCVITTLPPKSLTLSPPNGRYITSQTFDLVLLADTAGEQVVAIESGYVNDVDITSLLQRRCAEEGLLASGELIYRCRGFSRRFMRLFGAGIHNIDVNLLITDGTILNGNVIWEVDEPTN